jgi:hypothetical protein
MSKEDYKMYKGWDYRVVKNQDANGVYYGITRVYVDESEDDSHIDDGISCPIANDFDSLVEQLEEMLGACKRPVIDYNTGEEEKD